MAEAVRKSKLYFLKLIAKLFASLLSLFGVLSSCDYDRVTATYGIEGVHFHGYTFSSGDNSNIPEIQVKLSSIDSTVEFAETTSDSSGSYYLGIDTDEITLPDSVLLTATDIDGEENGSFISKDTLLVLDESEFGLVYDINFFLPEDTE